MSELLDAPPQPLTAPELRTGLGSEKKASSSDQPCRKDLKPRLVTVILDSIAAEGFMDTHSGRIALWYAYLVLLLIACQGCRCPVGVRLRLSTYAVNMDFRCVLVVFLHLGRLVSVCPNPCPDHTVLNRQMVNSGIDSQRVRSGRVASARAPALANARSSFLSAAALWVRSVRCWQWPFTTPRRQHAHAISQSTVT